MNATGHRPSKHAPWTAALLALGTLTVAPEVAPANAAPAAAAARPASEPPSAPSATAATARPATAKPADGAPPAAPEAPARKPAPQKRGAASDHATATGRAAQGSAETGRPRATGAVAPPEAAAGSPAAGAPGATGTPGAARAPRKTRQQPHTRNAQTRKAYARIVHFLKFFHPSTLWYLQYRFGDTGGDDGDYNRFFVGRGYVTLKFKPTRWLEARATLDTHQDEHGDWKLRLKYMYAKFKLPIETAVVTQPFVEFGIVHMPWLDYEEHTNYFRVQGTMFTERNKLHNSADVGITLGTLLGRKLPKKVARALGDKYPGSWGSLAVGVYNGTGYHGIEQNTNKAVEGRLSIRPGGPYFPYLQLSYFFTYGKGANPLVIEDDPTTPADEGFTGDPPTWQNNIAMLSFMHTYGVLTAQYVFGTGTQKGHQSNWLYEPGSPDGTPGEARSYRGASVFLEARLPWIRSSLFGRYDWWDGPYAGGTDPYHRIIAGYAYHFWGRHQNMLLVDFEYLLFDAPGDPRENQWAVTLSAQVHLH